MGFLTAWVATRAVLKAGEAMIVAAEKLAGIPEMTLAARRLLKLLGDQERLQREWLTKLETMDRNQGAVLNALQRMGSIRVVPGETPPQSSGIIVGTRPGIEEPAATSERGKSGSDKRGAHI